jgi:hypothetical protein
VYLAASSCTGACNGITADASQEGGTADKCLVSFYATQAACEAVGTVDSGYKVEACTPSDAGTTCTLTAAA